MSNSSGHAAGKMGLPQLGYWGMKRRMETISMEKRIEKNMENEMELG